MLLDTGLMMLNKTLALVLPDNDFVATIYSEIATAYISMNNSDTALAILMKAHEVCPENTNLLFKIAYQYDYYLQAPYKALPWYREFLIYAREPDEQEARGPQQVSMIDYAKKRIQHIAK
jgi:tetratricopeptide (TPR) repeat protein